MKNVQINTSTEVIDFNNADTQLANTEIILHLCLLLNEAWGGLVHKLFALWQTKNPGEAFPEWVAKKAAVFENQRNAAMAIQPRWSLSNDVLMAMFAEEDDDTVDVPPVMQAAARALLAETKGIKKLRKLAGQRIEAAETVQNFLANHANEEIDELVKAVA